MIRMEMRREQSQNAENHLPLGTATNPHHNSHSLPKKLNPIILTSESC